MTTIYLTENDKNTKFQAIISMELFSSIQNMKNMILIPLFCLFFYTSFSQTYLTPSLGYDFMSMTSYTPNEYYSVRSPSYSITSLQYGLELEQTIVNRISASANLNFTQKQPEVGTRGIVPYDGFKFNYWKGNISLNYRISNYLFVGLGYDYNQIRELKLTLRGETRGELISLMTDYGINLSVRTYWKDIELKGYFHKGLNENAMVAGNELNINPIDYFGLSLGYKIRLINASKKI